MSNVLTRDDFQPAQIPLSPRFMWKRGISDSTDTRQRVNSKWVSQESPGVSHRQTSPVSPYRAENAAPEVMPHGSPAALTDKSIWGRLDQFSEALNDAIELSETLVSEDEASPIDEQTFAYAMRILTPLFITMEIPAPLILPLQKGGVGAEWHAFGMNIELRFRNPFRTYAVLEDARGVIPPFHGRDPGLVQTHTALREFATRVE